jgi:hypothetical protein
LLQGIAICGRCGQRMSLRYSGPKGDYPVYCCRVGRDQHAGVSCHEVRALRVDAIVEGVLRDALAPDQIASLLADLNLHNTSIDFLIALPRLRLTALPFLVEHDFTYDKMQEASV